MKYAKITFKNTEKYAIPLYKLSDLTEEELSQLERYSLENGWNFSIVEVGDEEYAELSKTEFWDQ